MANGATPTFEWTEIARSSKEPGPRSRHCMVFDRGRKVTVMFGGAVWGQSIPLLSDIFELKDGCWEKVHTSTQPPPHHRGAMAYDEHRGYSVFFGGIGKRDKFLGGTWLYSERTWKKMRTWFSDAPCPRGGHCMAYDEKERAIVLYGGLDVHDEPLGDTWLFEDGRWKEVAGLAPHPRRYSAFAYDPVLQGCLLHAGSIDDSSRMQYRDEWLFRGRVWSKVANRFDTDPIDDQGMAFHEAASRMVMLEGLSGPRGVLTREAGGWQQAEVKCLHPRHQCAPLVWDENLDGLVLHGGEVYHRGPQFDKTLVLKLSINP